MKSVNAGSVKNDKATGAAAAVVEALVDVEAAVVGEGEAEVDGGAEVSLHVKAEAESEAVCSLLVPV
jgi:hypothetical protein